MIFNDMQMSHIILFLGFALIINSLCTLLLLCPEKIKTNNSYMLIIYYQFSSGRLLADKIKYMYRVFISLVIQSRNTANVHYISNILYSDTHLNNKKITQNDTGMYTENVRSKPLHHYNLHLHVML